MTSTRLARSTTELTEAGGAFDLGPDRTRLVARIFRLLAEGRPLSPSRIDATVTELGVDPDVAHELLQALPERNEAGEIMGLVITLNPTPHQMTLGDTDAYAWCALDTMMLSIILDRDIAVASEPPGSGQLVRLTAQPTGVTDIDPADAVITWPAPLAAQVDLGSTSGIWATFCHHSFFFASRTEAEQWATDRDDIEILTLDEGFSLARDIAEAWLRYDH